MPSLVRTLSAVAMFGFALAAAPLCHAAEPGPADEAIRKAIREAGITPERAAELMREVARETKELANEALAEFRREIAELDRKAADDSVPAEVREHAARERERKARLADTVAARLAMMHAQRDRSEASGPPIAPPTDAPAVRTLAPNPFPADDTPQVGPAVTVDVTIVEFSGVEPTPATEPAEVTLDRLRELAKAGKPAAVTRMRLTTLDNQTAEIEQGDDLPVPSGQTFLGGPGGQPKSQMTYQRSQFGTTVNVIPRIEENGDVVMLLGVERTRLGQSPPPSDQGFVPPGTEKLSMKATVRVPNGQTVVAHSSETPITSGSIIRAILVTARVEGAEPQGNDPAEGERP